MMGEDGVKRDILGFPVFSKEDNVFTATLDEELYMSSDNMQFKECTEQLKQAIKDGKIDGSIFNEIQRKQIENGSKRIKGYIWHHDKVTGRIQLVKSSVHDKAKHTGGKVLWGGGKENR